MKEANLLREDHDRAVSRAHEREFSSRSRMIRLRRAPCLRKPAERHKSEAVKVGTKRRKRLWRRRAPGAERALPEKQRVPAVLKKLPSRLQKNGTPKRAESKKYFISSRRIQSASG